MLLYWAWCLLLPSLWVFVCMREVLPLVTSTQELVFSRPNARKISFADIASRSKLTIEEVQLFCLVM